MKKSIFIVLLVGGLVFAGLQIFAPQIWIWGAIWTSGIITLAMLVVASLASLPTLVSQEEILLALERSRRPFLAPIEVVVSIGERTGNSPPDLEEVSDILEAMAAEGTLDRKTSPVVGMPERFEVLFALPERAGEQT